MADQPITGLPTKTASGVAATDKMLGIDSAEGYQILVRDVAKYIIENCDVSTLAGAARTPKAAIDLLNSKSSNGGINSYVEYYTNTDANTHSTAGIRYYAGGCTNVPTDYVYIVTIQSDSSGDISQVAFGISTEIYRRFGRKDGSYFSEWEKVPDRAEFDILNSNTIKSTSGNHVVSTLFDSSYTILRVSNGTNFTNLVFYDNGKVEITRWADDQWKAGVVLRQADS